MDAYVAVSKQGEMNWVRVLEQTEQEVLLHFEVRDTSKKSYDPIGYLQ